MTTTLVASRALDARIMGLLGLTLSQVVSVPAYSTDMNAAVELLPLLNNPVLKKELGYWSCLCGDADDRIYVWGSTPALAICRAFMASKGVME